MRIAAAFLLLTMPVIACAQPAKATVSIPADAPPPARVARARALIDGVLPPGALRMAVQASIGPMTSGMMATFLPAKMQEEARRKDPYFDERMRRITKIMGEEVGRLTESMEPALREAMAVAYARRFNDRQLSDIGAFYATPSGRAFALGSLDIMNDPALLKTRMDMLPKLFAAMPAIAEKIRAATADLPAIQHGAPVPAAAH